MPSPSPSPDCRVAAPEWSRQCGPRRDDASPCCTTATASQPVRVDRLFFLLHSSRDRSSQPASAAAADPARKQIPRAASGTADPWSGWRGGCAGRVEPSLCSRDDQGLDGSFACKVVHGTTGLGQFGVFFILCERARPAWCCSPVPPVKSCNCVQTPECVCGFPAKWNWAQDGRTFGSAPLSMASNPAAGYMSPCSK